MKRPLWKLIKEIEENEGITECYLHHEYDTGELELNIVFKNKIADETLKNSGIEEISSRAYWE